MKYRVLLIILIILVILLSGYTFWILSSEKGIALRTNPSENGITVPATPAATSATAQAINVCGGFPNDSTQQVASTGRLFIKLPKSIFPNKTAIKFTTISGTATAGWISNAGPFGESYGATTNCWSYYYEFDGVGEVDLTAPINAAPATPYTVRFMIGIPAQNTSPTQAPPATSAEQAPTTCTDEPNGAPIITSISPSSAKIGETIIVHGCNLAGLEGDKNIWLQNNQGIKGILYGTSRSTQDAITITLSSPLCQTDTSYSGLSCAAWLTLSPGTYTLYTIPWGISSNIVHFTVLP